MPVPFIFQAMSVAAANEKKDKSHGRKTHQSTEPGTCWSRDQFGCMWLARPQSYSFLLSSADCSQ